MASRYRRVVWSQSAEEALDEAIAFLAQESPIAARKLLEKTLSVAASLATLSKRGSEVPEVDDPTVRQILSDPHRLIYHVEEERVVILAFLHQRQDVEGWTRSRRP